MAYSYTEYTGDGTTQTFTIPFAYEAQSEVAVFVAGTQLASSDFSFLSTSTISINTAPANNANVRVERNTDLTNRAVDFVDGAVLSEADLDTAMIQVFHGAQEAIDTANDAVSLDADGAFDAQSRRIKNVADPSAAQDAATKNYIENVWLTPSDKTQLNNLNLTNLNTVANDVANVNTTATNITDVNTVASDIADVNTVAGDSADIQTLAAISTDITTAAGISSDITTVAAKAAAVQKVADDLNEQISEVETVANDLNEITSEIETVANSITNVDTVGTNIGNVNTVAGINANVTSVAGNASNINAAVANAANINAAVSNENNITAVANNETNINAVNSNSTNINTVAGNTTNITTVATNNANVTTVASNIADVQTAATNVADIQTIATEVQKVITVANDLNEATSEIDTVAASIANVDAVGADIANVNAVAGNATNINAVNANSTNINAVAGNETNINAVAGNETNINAVNTNSANINAVAGNESNITSVAGNATNINAVAGNETNINAVNSNSTNINAVAGNSTNINAVNANATNINTVAGAETNINTVASNIADVNSFADTYSIGSTAPASPTAGDLWFDTSVGVNTMKVYNGTSWQNAGSSVNGTSARFKYTATSGQTTFSGSDANGDTLAYDSGYIDVFLNGIHLDPTDYTATNGTSIVLASGAALNDELYVVAFGTFTLADHYNKTDSDARYLQPTGDGSQLTGINTDLVSDTSPQLGGNLDLNSNDITGTGNINITGTGTVTSGQSILTVSSSNTSAGNEAEIKLTHAGNNTYEIKGGRDLIFSSDNGANERVRITTAGNVGIGTSSPEALLHVQQNANGARGIKIENYYGANASAYLYLTTPNKAGTGESSAYLSKTNSDGGLTIGNPETDSSSYTRFVQGSSERMRIDSSGHITTPYNAAFYAVNSGTGSDNGDGITTNPPIFPNIVLNRGSGYNASNTRFTAPVSGLYTFTGNTAYKQTNLDLAIRLTKNGGYVTDVLRFIGYPQSHSGVCWAVTIYLAANDYISLDTMGSTYHRNNNSVPNWFAGYLVG